MLLSVQLYLGLEQHLATVCTYLSWLNNNNFPGKKGEVRQNQDVLDRTSVIGLWIFLLKCLYDELSQTFDMICNAYPIWCNLFEWMANQIWIGLILKYCESEYQNGISYVRKWKLPHEIVQECRAKLYLLIDPNKQMCDNLIKWFFFNCNISELLIKFFSPVSVCCTWVISV